MQTQTQMQMVLWSIQTLLCALSKVNITITDHGTLRSMLDWRMPAGTSRGIGSSSNQPPAPPLSRRGFLIISVHQPPGAMIDKIRGSAELEESTALERWRTRPKTDCYKYFVISLLSLLEKKLHVNP